MRKKGEKKTWRDKILEKINSLPAEKRKKALLEFEVHEYCFGKSDNHTILIRDIPHPLIKLKKNGDWAMGWE